MDEYDWEWQRLRAEFDLKDLEGDAFEIRFSRSRSYIGNRGLHTYHSYGTPKRPEVRRVSGFNRHSARLLRDMNEQAPYMGAGIQRFF